MKTYLSLFFLALALTCSANDEYSPGKINTQNEVSNNGATLYNVTFDLPEGGSFKPEVGISYNSQLSGYGLAGYGINITGISVITSGGKNLYYDGEVKGAEYLANSSYFLDGKRLVLNSGTEGTDSAEYSVEGDPYTKVTFHGSYSDSSVDVWFEVQSPNGASYQYGRTSLSRLCFEKDGIARCAAWYISKAQDKFANTISYYYSQNNLTIYPTSIVYGENTSRSRGISCSVEFEYDNILSSHIRHFWLGGNSGAITKRLSRVSTKLNNSIYRRYELKYNEDFNETSNQFAQIRRITEYNSSGEKYPYTYLYWSGTNLNNYTHYKKDIDINVKHRNEDDNVGSFCAVDLNGDGISDIVRLCSGHVSSSNANNVFYNENYTFLYVSRSQVGNNGEVSYPDTIRYTLPANFSGKISNILGATSVMDADGDGYNDIILPYYMSTQFANVPNELFCIISGKDVKDFNRAVKYIQLALTSATEQPLFITMDVNGDGKDEIIYLEKQASSDGSYKGGIIYDIFGELEQEGLSFTLPGSGKRIFKADCNSDGLEDLIILHNNGYVIFNNNGYNGNLANVFSNANSISGTNVKDYWRVNQGDFNGDGLVDFFCNPKGESYFYLCFNQGNGSFSQVPTPSFGVSDHDTVKDNSRFSVNILDLNYDGLDDVVISKSKYKHRNIPHFDNVYDDRTDFKWLKSTGTNMELYHEFYSTRDDDGLESYIFVGDFNGDGYCELANYGSGLNANTGTFIDNKINIYETANGTAAFNRIHNITEGYARNIFYTYGKTTNPAIYTNGVSTPELNSMVLPITVVTEVREIVHGMPTVVTNFMYGDFKVQTTGKGALGFASFSRINTTSGITETTKINEWNCTYLTPERITVTTTTDNESSSVVSQYQTSNVGNSNYFSYVSSSLTTDYDGNQVATTQEYDIEKGVLTRQRTDFSEGMYKETEYASYQKKGNEWLPVVIHRRQKHSDSQEVFTNTTRFLYNSKGLPLYKYDNYGTSNQLTTTLTYDTYGNITRTYTTGLNVPTIRFYTVYDSSGRFVTEKYTNPESTHMTYSNDIWGNMLQEKDISYPSHPIVTTHTYNAWGALINTVLPDGNSIAYSADIDDIYPRKSYYTLEEPSNGPAIKKVYDTTGRLHFTESTGPHDIEVKENNYYDANGQLIRKQTVEGELVKEEYYTYDSRGRVVADSLSSGACTHYVYGNRSITATCAGRTTATIYDAWGNVKSIVDPVSSIVYTYNSNGKPSRVVSGNATIDMVYDQVGNKISMSDPDAGTTTYTYAADGRILSQTDGNDKATEYTYDALGRIVEILYNSYLQINTYGTSGASNNKLVSSEYEGFRSDFTYDNLGRLVSEVRTLEGIEDSFEFNYSYGSNGLLSNVEYPGGLNVGYTYDDNGFLIGMTANGDSIYKSVAYNGLTETSMFSDIINCTTTFDNYGFLRQKHYSYNGSTVDKIDFSFDNITGNLLSRQRGPLSNRHIVLPSDGVANPADSLITLFSFYPFFPIDPEPLPIERFTYDTMDRLVSVSSDSVETMTVQYADNGNIIYKSGVGYYSYDNQKKNAVSSLYGFGSEVNTDNVNITFDENGKVNSIYNISKRQTIRYGYGPDREKWYSQYTAAGRTPKYTIYARNYERVVENNSVSEYYYLENDVVIVKQSGQFSVYKAMTDNVGSILSVTNPLLVRCYDAEYDAWGRKTDGFNTIDLTRGYGGHEMLDSLGIINMDGRLYDPYVGRFLSPDNYVQEPSNSQNFNRYTYCLNNPLKYTDPSGEFFLFTMINAVKDFVVNSFGKVWSQGINAWTKSDNWHSTSMAFKIEVGMFKGSPGQVLSRFTWEAPQTFLGELIGNVQNTFYGVKNVGYYGGATAITYYSGGWGAFTLGSYINGSNILVANPTNALFQHEYGHYLQSRSVGPLYIPKYGIPSLIDAATKSVHRYHIVEQDANKRALSYFLEHSYAFKENTGPNALKNCWNFVQNPINGYNLDQSHYSENNQEVLNNKQWTSIFANYFWYASAFWSTMINCFKQEK